MKRFKIGMMICCVSMTAACGDNFASEAEKKAVESGKTSMYYERDEASQTTNINDEEAVHSMLLVFGNDVFAKAAIKAGEMSMKKKDGHTALRIRNLDGNADPQTVYVSKLLHLGMIPSGKLSNFDLGSSKLQGGYFIFQSNLTDSFVEGRLRSGKTYDLAGQEVTAEDFRKGVRVDFSVVDGAFKSTVKR